jgi:hypothetical protein
MISLSEEKLLSLPAAAKSLPGRPHLATIYRHFQRGIRGIKLEKLDVSVTVAKLIWRLRPTASEYPTVATAKMRVALTPFVPKASPG